ncbi:tetratricopeptide repeat protein, partial [Halomonas sp. BC1]|uniref:tetratricopeptide repeat protein n=1 Tax=Halomonas sp. BC1 TaxID=1670448 RepID=UPI001592EAC1
MGKVSEVYTCKDFSIYRHTPEKAIDNLAVVCFDEIDGGLNKKGFGVDFLLSNNLECFFVSHAKKSFFQWLSEDDLLLHLGPFLKGKKTFTYGASLGGYAALYYSDVLQAKAIAFSPRCSIDPLYDNAKQFDVNFKHIPLSKKELKSNLSPVVVVDPQVPPDKKFLVSRILPLYKENISLIELPGASHHSARALSSQGVLKKFFLKIVFENNVSVDGFDAMSNAISLSHMALSAANNKKFKDANFYLDKLVAVGKQPNESMRLDAYLLLSEEGKVTHKFNIDSIYVSEKRIIYNRYFRKIKSSNRPQEALLFQVMTYINLLQFDKAVSFASDALTVYPDNKELKEVLQRSKRLYANTKGFLLKTEIEMSIKWCVFLI